MTAHTEDEAVEKVARSINEVANKEFNAWMIDKRASFWLAAKALTAYHQFLSDRGYVIVPRELPAEVPEKLACHFDNDQAYGTPESAKWFWRDALSNI